MIFKSIADCAKALGLRVQFLESVKQSGCDAFKWGRVDAKKLLEWLSKKAQPEYERGYSLGEVIKMNTSKKKAPVEYATPESIAKVQARQEVLSNEFNEFWKIQLGLESKRDFFEARK